VVLIGYMLRIIERDLCKIYSNYVIWLTFKYKVSILVLITLSKDTILLLLLNVQIKAKSLGERKLEFTVHLKRSP